MGNSLKNIEGVNLTKLKQFHDERGAVYHYIKTSSPEFAGFGEIYYSKILSNVIKGWKLHKESTQNFCVPYGVLKIVLVDNRTNSTTYGNIIEIILNDSDHYYLLTIPPNIWYSFKSLSLDFTLLSNLINIEHNPSEGENLPLNSSKIQYKWM
jgi:dTDP-4-dehydrorhamnose 3,5-epimerase